jgi:hypothetical protein
MKRILWPLLAAGAIFLAVPTIALADNGKTSPTLSFFSGGDGAQAHWLVTSDQPSGDSDSQAIQLQTTNDAPTFAKGYAGILVHHVTGIPAASFPDSSFWLKAPPGFPLGGTEGSPRLVVGFQNAAGEPDGNAELDQVMRGTSWQEVSDVSDPGNSGWDIHSKSCGFMYHKSWSVAQSCHTLDAVSFVFLVADAYGIHHLIDDINVDGKAFTDAADNSYGNNEPAGPTATTDPSLLPPLLFPPL